VEDGLAMGEEKVLEFNIDEVLKGRCIIKRFGKEKVVICREGDTIKIYFVEREES